jgi:hypothetical protein
MIFSPFALCDASTTEGDEYALEVTHVQCRTNKRSIPRALARTVRRVSNPKMPFCLGCPTFTPTISEMSSPTVALDAELLVVVFSLFAFLGVTEAVLSTAVDVDDVPGTSLIVSGVSGSVGSIYVSRTEDRATAAVMQTTGVSVSIRRTITPAK